jgi:electron transport complex protein RnfG
MINEDTKKMIITGFKLFLICAISAVSLSALNMVTKGPIENRKTEEENLVRDEFVEVFKEQLNLYNCTAGSKITFSLEELEELKKDGMETVAAYYPVNSDGTTVGYIVELSAKGYGGPMKQMVLYKTDGEIVSVELMDNDETPGLGKKAEDESYMNKFIGTGGPGYPVPISKDMLGGSAGSTIQYRRNWSEFSLLFGEWLFGKSEGQTDSVTGATITFNGVSEALAQGALFIKTLEGGM